MNQNSKNLIVRGNKGAYKIIGIFEGKSYELSIRTGKVGSFYPLP